MNETRAVLMSFDANSEPGVIGAAVSWLQGALLGSVATAAAVIAVASVGFLMLSGRIEVRRAVQVVLGCFILFGASTIAAGIQEAIAGTTHQPMQPEPEPTPTYAPVPPPPPVYPHGKPVVSDPYAGAAVPTQQ